MSINKPDTLRLNRQSGRGMVAVGLPVNGNVFIQEYWLDRKPYYAIANTSAKPVKVTISEWSGAAVGSLLVSLTIAPQSVEYHEIRDSLLSYNGKLLAVSLEQNKLFGLLRTPEIPVVRNRLLEILTIEGLNGLGDRYANLECWQSQIVFNTNDTISLTLRIPDDFEVITLNENYAQDYLPRLMVTEAASQTLGIKKLNETFTISRQAASQAEVQEVTLLLKSPVIENRMMTSFAGRVNVTNGGSFSFARGVIIDNTE